MAKCTGALGSLDTSGKFGNMIVFAKWKGRQYARLLVTPKNPQSDSQALKRSYLGALGKALSTILTAAKDTSTNVGSLFYQDAVAGAPAGQSWISWVIKKIIGTNGGTIAGYITAFTALEAGPKGYYQAAAESLGISDFNLSYGEQDAVDKGAVMYALCDFAQVYLPDADFADFVGGISTPTQNELAAYVASMNTANV